MRSLPAYHPHGAVTVVDSPLAVATAGWLRYQRMSDASKTPAEQEGTNGSVRESAGTDVEG
eukprot:COSAG01_NODE_34773_length_542_cov_1.112867_1_plen_60_part_01